MKNLPVPKIARRSQRGPRAQRGALMVLVLLILLVVSMLGMSTMDATGLEMQMSSNSREYQQAFEAAEYTLSWVENRVQSGDITDSSLLNDGACGATCFDAQCSGGYCFDNLGDPTNVPTDPNSCQLGLPATEAYESEDVWDDDVSDGRHHQVLDVPSTDLEARYIIEFRCYTSKDPAEAFDPAGEVSRVYRITALVVGNSGRTRVMLRSTMKDY